MTAYEALIKEGDKLQYAHKPDAAIKPYARARDIGGDRDHYVEQMIGICHQNADRHRRAIKHFDEALQLAETDVERGNVLRDKAESLRALGELEAALELLEQSVRLLPQASVEWANTLHYLGRMHRTIGSTATALREMGIALHVLTLYKDRNRLYVTLDKADTLAINGNELLARASAIDAFLLAIRYGGWPQRARALLTLLVGDMNGRLTKKYVHPAHQ